MSGEAEAPQVTCAICMTPLSRTDATAPCPSCAAPYHVDCWDENGGCAVYGCPMVPKSEGLKPLEIPPAFWGRQEKDCPRCGAQIMAMAVRCRHCGATVEAKIESRGAYDRRQMRQVRAPRLKRLSLVFLIASLLPIASLVSATIGAAYYRKNCDDIRKLPGGYDGYYRIAVGLGVTQAVIFACACIAYWIRFVLID